MTRDFITQLLESPPLVHNQGENCWRVSPNTARRLANLVEPSFRTVETGCGLSTLLFAAKAKSHTCIVPSKDEVERLTHNAQERNISLENVRFVIEKSQLALAQMQKEFSKEPFDLALIDGCHAFPSPFIDWYFVEPALRPGGYLIIDDTQIWTGRVLRDFLRKDEAWELLFEPDRQSSFFKKLQNGSTDRGWDEQPLVAQKSRLLTPLLLWQRALDKLFQTQRKKNQQ